jgi:hypothetical protein
MNGIMSSLPLKEQLLHLSALEVRPRLLSQVLELGMLKTAASQLRLYSQRLWVGSPKETLFFGLNDREVSEVLDKLTTGLSILPYLLFHHLILLHP